MREVLHDTGIRCRGSRAGPTAVIPEMIYYLLLYLLMNKNLSREGCGRGHPSCPDRGSGAEPQTPTLFNYIMLKTLHKTACKSGNCIFIMNEFTIIRMLDLCTTIIK